MNWKINYWTLIAALMTGGFIISYMNNTTKAVKWRQQITQIDNNVDTVLDILTAETDCASDSITIPIGEAFSRIANFGKNMQEIREALKGTPAADLLPINLGQSALLQMKLPKCETIQMFEAAPDGNITLYLTLEDVPNEKGEKMVSAIFAASDILTESGELNQTKAGGATFFDFIEPCPPVCGED